MSARKEESRKPAHEPKKTKGVERDEAVARGYSRYYNTNGTVRGLVFWSAQASSGGIGTRIVSIGASEFQISPGRLYGVRAILPASP